MAWNKTTLKISDISEKGLEFKPKRGLQLESAQPGKPKPTINDLTRKFQVDDK